MKRITTFPPIRALIKVLSNDSVIYAAVAILAATYLDTHEYDQLITGAVLAFAGLLIGSSEWSDVQRALSPFRAEIEAGLTELVHNTLSVTLPDGQVIEIDWPDSLEPALVAELVKGLTGTPEPEGSDNSV